MASSSKKSQDAAQKILRDLASLSENRFCFDCNQRGPTYVNMSIGSFVCTSCGGALRKYNQRVKSISMSNFNMQEIFFLKKRGNKACQKIYMALCDGEPREKLENFDEFLRLKYEIRKWYREPGPEIEEEALCENQEALDRVSQTPTPKTNRIGVNAAAGLIILPSRSLPSVLSHASSTTSSQSRPNESSQSGPGAASSPQPLNNISRLLPPTQTTVSSPPSSMPSDAKGDPFADLIAARPTTQPVCNQPPPPSQQLFDAGSFPFNPFSSISPPQQAVTTTTTATSVAVSSTQKNGSADFFHPFPTVSQAPPSFLAPATANFVSNQSEIQELANSTQPNAFSCPAPVPADKYAALAELDGMRKVTASSSASRGLDNFLNGPSLQSQALPQASHAVAPLNTFQYQGNTNPPAFRSDQFTVFEQTRPQQQQQPVPANPFFTTAPATSLMNPLGLGVPSAIPQQPNSQPGNPFVVQSTASAPTNPFASSCPAPPTCPPSAFNVPFSSFHTSAPSNGVNSSGFNPFVNAR